MNDFDPIEPAELAKLKAERSKGNQIKPANRKILSAFEALDGPGAFPAPVPEMTDADAYAKRVSNFLTTQGHKNRSVFVNPKQPKQIVVERTEREAA